jgi:hypothetical protein
MPKMKTRWADSVKNPENREFVVETAFNKGIPRGLVSQKAFNKRYEITPDSVPVKKEKKSSTLMRRRSR